MIDVDLGLKHFVSNRLNEPAVLWVCVTTDIFF